MKKLLALFLTLSLLVIQLSASAAVVQPGRTKVIIGFEHRVDKDVVKVHGGKVVKEFGFINALVVELPAMAVDALSKTPNVKYIEPDYTAYATVQTTPWGITKVNAPSVHTAGATGTGVKVAVVDTGINTGHEDLNLNVKGGYSTFGGSYIDDNGHGTHVAGTIAALNNTIGVIGVAPNASLYSVKVLNSAGSGSYSGIIDGINWCINNGIDIINMSLGGSQGSTALKDACDAAYNSGILLVAAAGNEGTKSGRKNTIGYPAKYASVMAVGSITSSNTRSSFSSTGAELEIMAPGQSIQSTYYNGGYATMSGTSMASPHVAGVAALIMSAKTSLTNVEVRNILNTTANDMWNNPTQYGNGLVDSYAAYQAVIQPGTKGQ